MGWRQGWADPAPGVCKAGGVSLTPVRVLLVVAVAGSWRQRLAVLGTPTFLHHLRLEARVQADLKEETPDALRRLVLEARAPSPLAEGCQPPM